jgi:hypothetical protein
MYRRTLAAAAPTSGLRDRNPALGNLADALARTKPVAYPPTDYCEHFAALTGISLRTCPRCDTGTMVVTACIARVGTHSSWDDTL